MNGRTIKKLRHIARQLPTTVELKHVKSRVPKKALTKPEQAKVAHLPGDYVIRESDKVVEIDHLKRLKKYYLEDKTNFLGNYFKWLIPHHLEMQKRFPEFVGEAKTPESGQVSELYTQLENILA